MTLGTARALAFLANVGFALAVLLVVFAAGLVVAGCPHE